MNKRAGADHFIIQYILGLQIGSDCPFTDLSSVLVEKWFQLSLLQGALLDKGGRL